MWIVKFDKKSRNKSIGKQFFAIKKAPRFENSNFGAYNSDKTVLGGSNHRHLLSIHNYWDNACGGVAGSIISRSMRILLEYQTVGTIFHPSAPALFSLAMSISRLPCVAIQLYSNFFTVFLLQK